MGKMSKVRLINDDFLWYEEGWEGDDFSELGYVRGDVDLRGWTHDLPDLEYIGGSVYLGGYSGNLPKLHIIGGDADLQGYPFDLPELTQIGRMAFLRGYLGNLPRLERVGDVLQLQGYLYNLPNLEKNTPCYVDYKAETVPIEEYRRMQGFAARTIGADSKETEANEGVASIYTNGFKTHYTNYGDGKPLFSTRTLKINGKVVGVSEETYQELKKVLDI